MEADYRPTEAVLAVLPSSILEIIHEPARAACIYSTVCRDRADRALRYVIDALKLGRLFAAPSTWHLSLHSRTKQTHIASILLAPILTKVGPANTP